jgi:hypothetical protein
MCRRTVWETETNVGVAVPLQASTDESAIRISARTPSSLADISTLP